MCSKKRESGLQFPQKMLANLRKQICLESKTGLSVQFYFAWLYKITKYNRSAHGPSSKAVQNILREGSIILESARRLGIFRRSLADVDGYLLYVWRHK